MTNQMSTVARFSMDDEAGFEAHVHREPRTVVMFHGRQCPYSHRFLSAFEEAASGDEAWTFAVRDCRVGGEGPVGERYGISITPTVVAFRDGKPWRRLEARTMVGITPHRFQEWLDQLDEE